MQFIVRTDDLKRYLEILKKDFLVYYPIKANSNHSLVSFLDEYVDGYEVDSLLHVSTLIKRHNVLPTKILYSYPLKNHHDIRVALNMGIRNFVVDDLNESLEILKKARSSIDFIIRVDVASYIEIKNLFTKWGASFQEIQDIKKAISNSPHRIKGFSFYLPQEINTYANFELIIKRLFSELGASNYEVINIGGGISDEMLPVITSLVKHSIGSAKTKIIIEQGQHLLNRAIDLQVNILDIRYKNGHKMVYIDSGIYHGLLDVILKKKSYKIVADGDSYLEKCLVCGDSSDVSDVIGVYDLPANIKCGDMLTIIGCGAYCEEFITPFSKRKKPALKLT